MSLDGPALQPARQPEAVASSLVGNRDPLNQLSRLLGFVAPAMQQLQQYLRIRIESLERSALKSWNNRCDEPLRLAHLDHDNQRRISVEAGEGPGRVKCLRHGGAPFGWFDSAKRWTPSPLPHSIYGAVERALTSGFATAELHHSAGHDLIVGFGQKMSQAEQQPAASSGPDGKPRSKAYT
ncbi:hypothetical protein NKH89_34640 [Mesorhizobium sp. M0923]|uniref:hypothetical protein n=1 Tax=Mesorhizobium sp. M0923 TaxID=2957028 RepID=UPI00333BF778